MINRRLVFGSPTYSYYLPSISANSEYKFSIENINEKAIKYLPMNFLYVANNSLADLMIFINQNKDNAYFVKSNSSLVLEPKDLLGYYSLTIKNLSDTNSINQNEVIIQYARKAMNIDILMQNIVEMIK
ncbi:MAG: hypothetical protein QW474_02255 [Candidatus Aenigmatarchaeota archaeon]